MLLQTVNQAKQADRHRGNVTVQLNVRMGKRSELSDFERGMIVDVRHTIVDARSSISEMSDLFTHDSV